MMPPALYVVVLLLQVFLLLESFRSIPMDLYSNQPAEGFLSPTHPHFISKCRGVLQLLQNW